MTKCWEWPGPRNGSGYGLIRIRGRYIGAHRAMYQLVHGEIPNGLGILHRCDNPPCVNPGHLYAGTPADNVRDMVERGRNVVMLGEQHGMAKLTATMAEEVVARRASGQYPNDIARDLNLKETTVRDVLNGKTWAHLTRVRAGQWPEKVLPPLLERRCWMCNTVKPMGEFYNDKTNFRGKMTRCKSCCSSVRARRGAET